MAESLQNNVPVSKKGHLTAGLTIRSAVVAELERLGRARNIQIARALGIKPSSVGYVLYQLRMSGCARRLGTGSYQFVKMPRNLRCWNDGIDMNNPPTVKGQTMPERILNAVTLAPNGGLSFLAIQKIANLPRNVTGAVLSDLVRRGLLERLHRGVYRLPQA
jgi:predicted transcriptional regulator of viral defense system